MLADSTYKEKLKNWLAKNYLKEIAESLITSLKDNPDPGAMSIREEAFNLAGRLQSAKQEYQGGRIERDEFELDENKIRASLNAMIDALEPDWGPAMPPPAHSRPVLSNADPLDVIFKFLLLGLGLVSVGLFIHTMVFQASSEKFPLFILSIVGCSGGFFGYGKWRLIELQRFSNQLQY
ncbi:MAG: hypothetical protein IT260_22540 [Saprospiraceae bacterium]|nr:hypothetical protein [Saprospiraceae bacterium]